MHIYPKERRSSTSLLRLSILTVLIVISLWFLRQIIDGREWVRVFDPTPTPTAPAISYINQGDILFAEGKLQQAIEAFDKAIELEPDNDIPYMKQAGIFILTRDTGSALNRAEQAVLLAPDKAENLAGYCQALDWEGQYGPASDACECAIELDPSYAPGHAFLSEVYADQAFWGPARTTAEEAIAIDFQNAEAHHNMGYALEVQGRYGEAIEFYENAITLRPNLGPYYVSAGQGYYSLGDYETAADRFGKAIKLNPLDPVGYDQLGWTYYSNGEPARAIDALEQAISVDPTHARAWGRLATIYYLRQNYEQAIKNFPIAIDLSENSFLQQARSIEIYAEIQTGSDSETVPILRGRFTKDTVENSTSLTAFITPIEWVQTSAFDDQVPSCGHIIARNIEHETFRVNPAQDLTFSDAFSQTTGTAVLDLITADLTLDLTNIPQPNRIPYEVRIRYRPAREESVGFAQPNADNIIAETFSLQTQAEAPIEYYYGLGLSYVYMNPPQCNEATPWLLKAVERDASYFNPAWAGFSICPNENTPPTPIPPPTPTPEDATNG